MRSWIPSARRQACLFAGLVAVVGCEPEVDEPVVERGRLEITAFLPTGRVECADGCSIDLGEVPLGVVRETPLQFLRVGGDVLVTELRRDGCPSFTARPPGELTTRATTSIRLVTAVAGEGGEAGVCATTFSVVTTAQNAVDGVITIEVQATLVDDGGAGEETGEEVPG